MKAKCEAPALGAAARRMVTALVRRAGDGDTEALEQLAQLQTHLTDAITAAGTRMHDEAGYSYTQLGDVLGISRQGARQRFTA